MVDPFRRMYDLPRRAAPIVPHATNPIAGSPEFIYVGKGGDVVCRPIGGSEDVTMKGVREGSTLMLRVSHIRVAGTTAGEFLGLYYS